MLSQVRQYLNVTNATIIFEVTKKYFYFVILEALFRSNTMISLKIQLIVSGGMKVTEHYCVTNTTRNWKEKEETKFSIVHWRMHSAELDLKCEIVQKFKCDQCDHQFDMTRV